MIYTDFINTLNSLEIEYKQDYSLSLLTTMRVGGNCDIVCFPKNENEIKSIFNLLRKSKMHYYILGNGSNVIAEDKGYKGVIICTKKFSNKLYVNDTEIYTSAGVMLSPLCKFTAENALSGLEFAYGIPGTVGGALYMNAGAYGGQMGDIVKSVTCIDNNFNIITLNNSQLNYGYRQSIFMSNNYIILGANFKLKKGNKSEILAKMDSYMEARKSKQPLEYPSAGSFFKRPVGAFAGKLIEDCNLKGYKIGGAEISEKHAGFLINRNNATCEDIHNLAQYVRNTVQSKTGYTLEPEAIFLN